MSDYFMFNITETANDEIKISVIYRGTPDYIYLKKSSIAWIIRELRNMSKDEYYEMDGKSKELRTPEYVLVIDFNVVENSHSWINIFPYWNDRNRITPAIRIPYFIENEYLLMGECIEPVLSALEQYIPEEERSKLPKPWLINMTGEEWDKNREKVQDQRTETQEVFKKEWIAKKLSEREE